MDILLSTPSISITKTCAQVLFRCCLWSGCGLKALDGGVAASLACPLKLVSLHDITICLICLRIYYVSFDQWSITTNV